MRAGTIVSSCVPRVVFGTADPKAGAAGSVPNGLAWASRKGAGPHREPSDSLTC
jgi:tRNA(Arg) A34 adenosine deaminase TadA